MLSLGGLHPGVVLLYREQPHLILSAAHVQMGRGGAVSRTKLRNIITDAVLEVTFKEGDRMEEADISRSKATFLYRDESGGAFMDTVSFDQFTLPTDTVEDQLPFLKEGQEVDVLLFDDRPIGIEIPKKVELRVTETQPGVRGDTAQGSVLKEATVETGYVCRVPLFVTNGEVIRINTETGEYVERV